jgi:hypothetical protein
LKGLTLIPSASRDLSQRSPVLSEEQKQVKVPSCSSQVPPPYNQMKTGYIFFIAKFIGLSPNFIDAPPSIRIKK